MPVFNAAKTLKRAVESVRLQDWEDWELLLVEDGSTDGSAEICETLSTRYARVDVIRQLGNTGAAAARNTGIRAARGRYLAFLDADDEWLPDKLSRQLAFMRAQGAVFSYTGFWRQRGRQCHQVRVPGCVTRQALLKGNVIGCLTAIYDRKYFGTVEMPPLRLRQDFALWLDLLARCDRAYGLNQPLAVHHVRAASLSAPRGRAMQATWQLYHQYLGLSGLQSAWYMSNHLLRRLRRG
ncbi:glycosyltransferase [Rhodobacteraceae bacterium CY05]|uniref:Glycosyltransferase n=2 Tax=Parasedimentitalea huanghaiensis TaxID=2682100 RepID=A0A6L6WLH4_9RHOB|nr:glycosyltransferase [Zongyanglinia huanghaiensis]